MSIITQVSMVLLILLTGGIILYANRQLSNAALEGEQFVDEWALKQQKQKKMYIEKTNRIEKKDCDESMNDYEEEEADNKVIHTDVDLIIMVLDEDQKEVQRAKVNKLPYYIGRNKKNDLILNDLSVASEHCEIIRQNGSLLLRDRGTNNKIFTNGQIVDECVLHDQSRVYIGVCELIVKENHRSDLTHLAVR